uniref:C2H2-type domain-containing protein n=1 Tax=Maylandia zebra TaxID=106582 RepID=A0A3P9BMX7_9CICH
AGRAWLIWLYAASLRAHLARHKQQSSQRAPVAKPSVEQGSEGRADSEVDEKTSSSSSLTKREFVCDICGKTLPKLYSLRIHMLNHTGVKPFECLTCGVAWADARSLKRHVRTHTGERPYVCPMCQEAHIDARTLRKHMAKYHVDSLPGKIMLEKDTLQFHNQGTQVEHAVSILASDLPPELRPAQHKCVCVFVLSRLCTKQQVFK